MHTVSRSNRHLMLAVMLALVLLTAAPMLAQTGSAAVFHVYRCSVDQELSQIMLDAVLLDEYAEPLPAQEYDITIAGSDGRTYDDVSAVDQSPRSPLAMVIALDSTAPLPHNVITQAMRTHLLPGLLPQDQVAMMPFAEESFPRSDFYTDKQALAADHLQEVVALNGDGAPFTAALNAIESIPQNSDQRGVILLITEATAHEADPTPVSSVITEAQARDIQVFAIAVQTSGELDTTQLDILTADTGGRLWTVLDNDTPIGEALTPHFDALRRNLSHEVSITTELPLIEGRGTVDLPLDVLAHRITGATLSDSITCSFTPITHAIAFHNTINDGMISGESTLSIIVDTPFSPDQVRARFYDFEQELDLATVNAEGIASITLDAEDLLAGEHAISAELVTTDLRVLAKTENTLHFTVQHRLNLHFVPGEENGGAFTLSGEAIDLPASVQFTLMPVSDPAAVVEYGGPLPLDAGDVLSLPLADIRAAVETYFPDAQVGDRFLLSAAIPSLEEGAPLARSSSLVLRFTAPPAPAMDEVETPVVTLRYPQVNLAAPNFDALVGNGMLLLIAAAAALVFLNIILNREVRWARIRRWLKYPDNTPLSPQLMTVTIHRDNLRQAYTLTKRTVTVGRGPSNDINLGGDASISRQHGAFLWRRGHWYFCFRKRQVTARINGRRKRGSIMVRLRPVAEIEIGRTVMVFHSNAQQDAADYIKTEF